MSSLYAVIMAGGSGTRFWSASRENNPKQFLSLGPAGEPLLRATLRRLETWIEPENIFIATGKRLEEATRRLLPQIRPENILVEPTPRNTAPCIGWATTHIARFDPHARIAVLPSDHWIADTDRFRRTAERAFAGCTNGYITTVGIPPSRPETGYGYIEVGREIEPRLFACTRFIEKPNRTRAEELLRAKNYLWNAGLFFFDAQTMLTAIRTHLPELAQGLDRITEASNRGAEHDAVRQIFPTLPNISIDHGLLEKAERVAVVPADFDWSDVGSWQSAWELAKKDATGNVLPEETAIAIDATDNLVCRWSEKKRPMCVALVGVRDLVVVQTDDALLIVPRERAQDVRTILDELRARNATEFI